jgi:hypothetical protein
MNRYIGQTRRKQSGLFQRVSQRFQNISRKLKKHDKLPENLTDDKIHVEEKKPGFFARLFKGKTEEEKEEITEEIEKKPEAVQEEMKEIAEDYEIMEEVEEDVKEKKEGLFTKFKKVLKGKPKHSDDEDVPVEQVQRVMEGKPAVHVEHNEAHEDLKKISKITLHVVQMLPKEKQDEFKQSHEFAEYKAILEKHGLVK